MDVTTRVFILVLTPVLIPVIGCEIAVHVWPYRHLETMTVDVYDMVIVMFVKVVVGLQRSVVTEGV
jgi:hypothetical protein